MTGPNPPANCRKLGNGFAYPKGTPYPVPAQMQIVSPQGCVSLPLKKATDLTPGLYFLFYGPAHSAALGSDRYKQALKQSEEDSRYMLGDYADTECPGAPFFAVGSDNACN